MTIKLETGLSVPEYRHILTTSGLAGRRPVEHLHRLSSLLERADVLVTARREGELLGIGRAIFWGRRFCYLADLAVDPVFQRRGIGRRILEAVHAHACYRILFLIAVPEAVGYYRHLGLQSLSIFPRFCWKQYPGWSSISSEGVRQPEYTMGPTP